MLINSGYKPEISLSDVKTVITVRQWKKQYAEYVHDGLNTRIPLLIDQLQYICDTPSVISGALSDVLFLLQQSWLEIRTGLMDLLSAPVEIYTMLKYFDHPLFIKTDEFQRCLLTDVLTQRYCLNLVEDCIERIKNKIVVIDGLMNDLRQQPFNVPQILKKLPDLYQEILRLKLQMTSLRKGQYDR